jgi:hypothetical protein
MEAHWRALAVVAAQQAASTGATDVETDVYDSFGYDPAT